MTNNDASATSDSTQTGTNVVPLPTNPAPVERKPVAQFVHDHPVAIIAGGLAVGALAAAFLPKRNRTYVTKKASILAEAISAASVALAQSAMEKAESAGEAVRSGAGALGEKASDFGGAAKDTAQKWIPGLKPKPKSFAEIVVAKAIQASKRLQR